MSQAAVLIVEDDPALREALCDTLGLAGFPTTAAADGREALDLLRRERIGMIVSDVQMKPMDGHTLLKEVRNLSPELPMVLMTAYGTIEKAVAAMRDGAVDYLVKPFEAAVLVDMVSRHLSELHADDDLEIIAEDPRTRDALTLARRVAGSEVTVLLTGESGTGKEIFARFIHQNSARAAGPFVAINCAAIPENMLEALLFGFEKGAFTGAYQSRAGKFEQAQGGTLLLDEISEMDLGLQAKLLRVLQEREVERLGGTKSITLDVRVLATTNRALAEEVAAGRFREDLYYRLNVFPLHLPLLAERPGDIVPLAQRLLQRHCPPGRFVPQLGPDAQARLLEHDWPGNVRELDNVIQRALILQAGDRIEADDLRFECVHAAPRYDDRRVAEPGDAPQALDENLKTREQRLIIEALIAGRGSRKAAAERLGISPRTLRYKLARMREQGVAIP